MAWLGGGCSACRELALTRTPPVQLGAGRSDTQVGLALVEEGASVPFLRLVPWQRWTFPLVVGLVGCGYYFGENGTWVVCKYLQESASLQESATKCLARVRQNQDSCLSLLPRRMQAAAACRGRLAREQDQQSRCGSPDGDSEAFEALRNNVGVRYGLGDRARANMYRVVVQRVVQQRGRNGFVSNMSSSSSFRSEPATHPGRKAGRSTTLGPPLQPDWKLRPTPAPARPKGSHAPCA